MTEPLVVWFRVAGILFAVTGVFFSGLLALTWTSILDSDTATRTASQTIALREGEAVQVHLDYGVLIVQAGQPGQLRIDEEESVRAVTGSRAKADAGEALASVSRNRGTVSVQAGSPAGASMSRTRRLSLQLPSSAMLSIEASSGEVDVLGAFSSLDLQAGQGSVRIAGADASSAIQAHLGNGDLSYSGDVHDPGSLRLSVGNGQITAELPASVDASVRATTAFGTIQVTGFDLRPAGDRRSVTGTLGAGGPLVELTAGRGEIDLRRA